MSESKGSDVQNFKKKIDSLSFEGKIDALIMLAREEGKREAQKEIEARIAAAERLAQAAHFGLRQVSHNNCGLYAEKPNPEHCWQCKVAAALAEWKEAAK